MIRQTDIDGVPTLLAPTSGPMTAGLVFRVGRSDETLATSGITHLVEHLALHGQGVAEYHYNGSTSTVYTTFQVQGSETDVVNYLTGVCESLERLPMHRLETEKEILRTEAGGRSRGVNQQMPAWRYGAQGHGLVSYPEWGLSRLGSDEVEHWVHTWFTRQNAALWIAGSQIPSGLRLKLREGERMPVTAPKSVLPATPAYFMGDQGKIVLDAVVSHGAPGQVLAIVLERELFRSLRQDGGYSYTAATAYDTIGDGHAMLTAFADALPEKQDAALGAFIDVLAKLRAGYIDERDINFAVAKAEEACRHPEVHAGRVMAMAENLLTGQPNHALEELLARMRAVRAADIHTLFAEALTTTLLQIPYGHDARWAGFAPAPICSDFAVSGTTYRSLEHDTVRLVVGADGVSGITASEQVTVQFAECAVMLAWPDGARRLIGADGIMVNVEPTMFENGRAAVNAIDAVVPPSVVVWQPPRAAEQIPRPEYMKVRQGFSTRKVKIEALITLVVTLLFVAVFVAAKGALMMLSLLLVAIGLVRGFWLLAKVRNRTRAVLNQ